MAEQPPRKRGAVRTQPVAAPQPKPVSRAPQRRGAEQHKVQRKDKSRSWVRHHREVARQARQRLWQTPVATLMTCAVLAIALALPGFLLTGLYNLQQLAGPLKPESQVVLYLSTQLDDAAADRFSRQLLLQDDLAAVELISREQGLRDFSQFSGMAGLLEVFDENPLPAVIHVWPRNKDLAQLKLLRTNLERLAEVDTAVLDAQWLERLQAVLQLAQRSSVVLGLLLALTVLLVVGNTIRMAVESRRDEIQITKLVGATDAWVRRPFIYSGAWLGLFGAVLAWLLIQLSLLLLDTPVTALARLYSSQFELQGPGFSGALLLLLASLGLGVLGAYLAVSRHLREIEPR